MSEKDFIRFLKEQDCFWNYVFNFIKIKKYNTFHDFYNSCNFQKNNLISNLCLWRNTKEGFTFWRKIDDNFLSAISI